MKLLLDQDIFSDVAALLRGRGFDVLHTSEVGLARALDEEILQHAKGGGAWL